MDINQTKEELQKFADANNMNVDVSVVLDNMDAGDFIELNSAMDSSDNLAIMKILQKYKARISESFKYFNGTAQSTNKTVNFLKELSSVSLNEAYHKFCKYSTYDNSHLSMNEIRTLIYEDLAPSLSSAQSQMKASQIAKSNTAIQTSSDQMNPTAAAKLKQAEIQKNSGNPNYKVQIPGQSGQSQVADVIGIQPGQSTEQSLVVTKDPSNRGEVDVFSLSDVSPIQEDSDDLNDPCNDISDLLESIPDFDNIQGQQTVLSDTHPDMMDMINAVSDISNQPEVRDGSESPLGNSALDYKDEIEEIMNFCRKMDR